MRSRQRRPERACGIQSGPGKWTGKENAKGDRQANAEPGDGLKCAFFVDSSGKDGEHEEESGYSFKGHPRTAWKIPREFRGAQSDGVPGLVGNDSIQQKCGVRRTGQLRAPIENGIHRVYTIGD